MEMLRKAIERYAPCDAQEAQDRRMLLYAIDRLDSPLTRDNPFAHFTASSWIVNQDRTRALMAWHNIYRTWAWTGGHADGEADLLAVALREAREETGIAHIEPVRPEIYSIEVLPVNAHYMIAVGLDDESIHVSSWGRPFAIRREEYDQYVRRFSSSIVSNLLFVSPR